MANKLTGGSDKTTAEKGWNEILKTGGHEQSESEGKGLVLPHCIEIWGGGGTCPPATLLVPPLLLNEWEFLAAKSTLNLNEMREVYPTNLQQLPLIDYPKLEQSRRRANPRRQSNR